MIAVQPAHEGGDILIRGTVKSVQRTQDPDLFRRDQELFADLPERGFLRRFIPLHSSSGETDFSRLMLQKERALLEQELRFPAAVKKRDKDGGSPDRFRRMAFRVQMQFFLKFFD